MKPGSLSLDAFGGPLGGTGESNTTQHALVDENARMHLLPVIKSTKIRRFRCRMCNVMCSEVLSGLLLRRDLLAVHVAEPRPLTQNKA
jgi:hypothetical protein